MNIVCGDDCEWGYWARLWFVAGLSIFMVMSIKLVDARHQIRKQQQQIEQLRGRAR